MIQSPMNYTGGKYRLLSQILPLFPENVRTFVDLFCGGCNVGINVTAERYIYNDICEPLIQLYVIMKKMEKQGFIERVENIIEKYGLSNVKRNGYDFYNCSSSDGLTSYNRESYYRLRADVNTAAVHDEEYYIRLYVLIIYAFNNQIRFNKKGEFNLPPGKRDFNQKMYGKLSAFMDLLHLQQTTFLNKSYKNVSFENLDERDFVYADPPYLITCASYNENGGWTEHDEYGLLELLDSLDDRNIKFALSNVLESKGYVNEILMEWIRSRPRYKSVELNYTYSNANYHRQNKEKKTKEILVVNY